MQTQKKQFLSKLQDLSRSQSAHQTFSDWLEIAAITLHQLPYHSKELKKDAAFEQLEQCYFERIKPYSQDKLNAFAELMGITLAAHRTGYGDFLGEIAGEAELLNQRNGQFFTPYHLCRLMAKVTIGNMKEQVERKGIITISEPACGAGALVIASAEEIAHQGINPAAHVQFDCIDISRDAFNMTYIQLCAQNLQAVVHHGNTLSNEHWEHRPTPQLRMFSQWLAPQRRAHRLAQAMKSILMEESSTGLTPSVTSDSDKRVEEGKSLNRNGVASPLEDRRQPDIVLDRQMSLFD